MDFAYQRKTPTKRIGIFALVIFLHAMIIYALATGLSRKVDEVIHQPVEVRIIEEMEPMPQGTPSPQPALRPPPPKQAPKPKPRLRPRPVVPAPQAPVRRPAPPLASSAVTDVAPPSAPSSPAPEAAPQAPVASVETAPGPHIPVRTAPVVDARFCGKPEYPETSRRYEESGTVVLNFLIDADGRVIQSKIASSSGYDRLDEAARQALSLCRFKPGTVDGKPEKSWHKLKYVWKLDE